MHSIDYDEQLAKNIEKKLNRNGISESLIKYDENFAKQLEKELNWSVVSKNSTEYDENLAKQMADELNCTGITENAVLPKDKKLQNYRPRTLVDETLEYIDPTPNIYTLFIQFNEKFFWNKLLPVQVKWSPRMTSCAGICSFHPRNRECIISLSTPLLKLRPRKDLIETLLHEMIHAYLFLTNDNRDRDGHGPVFQSHMKRINKEAGTNITIYHSFHEEVRLYQQHWWRCNGPCQNKAPFFGTVRRSMNRAPGPNDFWWKDHQASCNGQFIKIKEPEKKKKSDSKKRTSLSNSTINKPPENKSILNWVNKSTNSTINSLNNYRNNLSDLNSCGNKNLTKSISNKIPVENINKSSIKTSGQSDLKKLGNSTNNVHGWGTGGPSENTNIFNISKTKNVSSKNVHPKFSFSGTVGGSGSGKSILLDKDYIDKTSNSHKKTLSTEINKNRDDIFYNLTKDFSDDIEFKTKTIVNCPNCNKSLEEEKINQHLDICLDNAKNFSKSEIPPNKKRKTNDFSSPKEMKTNIENICNKQSSNEMLCPLCERKIIINNFNEHLDNCVQNEFNEKSDTEVPNTSSSSIDLHDSPHICLICETVLKPNETLNEHLEDCVASVFNESTEDDCFDNNLSNNQIVDLSIDNDEQTDLTFDCHPCPVCMTLVKKSLMNDHLDGCLTKN